MFLAEKGVSIETVSVAINTQEHRTPAFLAKNPLSRVPVLELDDGRFLGETRAICTWFEGQHPEPNLMGADADERAFIEMHDRRAEFYVLLPIAHWIRHVHPGLAPLEQPQFPEYGQSQGAKLPELLRVFDAELASRPYWAGERFTIADITAFCAMADEVPAERCWADALAGLAGSDPCPAERQCVGGNPSRWVNTRVSAAADV
jgi:glutathione S-transferase